MADKKKSKKKKKSAPKERSGAGFFILAVLLLLVILVAEVALLLPVAWAPEPVRPYVEQAQETVPLPLPASGDPDEAIAALRAEHQETLQEIEERAQAEIEKIKQQTDELRAENKRLREGS